MAAHHHLELGAEDRLQADLLGGLVERDRPEHVAVVGEGDGVHPLLLDLLDEVLHLHGPVQHRVLGVDVEMDEVGHVGQRLRLAGPRASEKPGRLRLITSANGTTLRRGVAGRASLQTLACAVKLILGSMRRRPGPGGDAGGGRQRGSASPRTSKDSRNDSEEASRMKLFKSLSLLAIRAGATALVVTSAQGCSSSSSDARRSRAAPFRPRHRQQGPRPT